MDYSKERIFTLFVIPFLIVNLLDLLTTLYCFGGIGIEGNPFMAYFSSNTIIFSLIKFLGVALITLFIMHMLDEYHLNYPTPVYIGMGLSFMIPFVAVVNNLHVIVEALL